MRAAPDKENSWILYILKCSDGSFYAGITNDPARRLINTETAARRVTGEAEGR